MQCMLKVVTETRRDIFQVVMFSVQPLSDQYLLPSQRLYIVCKIPHNAEVDQNCSCTNYPLRGPSPPWM